MPRAVGGRNRELRQLRKARRQAQADMGAISSRLELAYPEANKGGGAIVVAQDPLKVAAASYKLVAENDTVRGLRATAEKSFSTPPNEPIGVQHALRMTVLPPM